MVSKPTEEMMSSLAPTFRTLSKSVILSINSTSAPETTVSYLSLQEKMLQRAAKNIKQKFAHLPGHDFACYRLENFPKFDKAELVLGKVLGQGEFGIVNEIQCVKLMSLQAPISEIQEQREDDCFEEGLRSKKEGNAEAGRCFVAQQCLRPSSKGNPIPAPRYALKQPKVKTFSNEKAVYDCIEGLAAEAFILAAMEHPHIVKLRGLSDVSVGSKDSFLLLDCLVGNLREKLKQWQTQQHKLARARVTITKSSKEARKRKKRAFFQERLKSARDISSAIAYLHERHIMHRDLKPENVGFDIRGDVKLFDFGLATMFDNKSTTDRKHTATTGSLPYMAPENYLGKPYTESVDIYSLSIVVWEVSYLNQLYPVFNMPFFKEKVIRDGVRPMACVDTSSTTGSAETPPFLVSKQKSQLASLLSEMWHADPSARPTAREVHHTLKNEVALASAESNNDVHMNLVDSQHRRQRRSTCLQERFTSSRAQAHAGVPNVISDEDRVVVDVLSEPSRVEVLCF
jgi:serine/threonine protein kinase